MSKHTLPAADNSVYSANIHLFRYIADLLDNEATKEKVQSCIHLKIIIIMVLQLGTCHWGDV